MTKKIVPIILIGFLLLTSITTANAFDTYIPKSKTIMPTTRLTTIYVDDDNTQGPWDGTFEHPYRTITNGVDNASQGDTVFVFNGIYSNEYIYVRKSIKLFGEDKYNTIIDYPSAVHVGNNQLIDGFEINNFMMKKLYIIDINDCSHCIVSENNIIGDNHDTRGISLTNCSNCTISNNNIKVHWDSITIGGGSVNNKIDGNYIYGFNYTYSGIDITSGSDNNIISNNIISNCEDGIDIIGSHRNIITDNKFINNIYSGISASGSDSSNNTISRNEIINNYKGIDFSGSDNIITNNTLADNTVGISLSYGKNNDVSRNIIDSNPCGIVFGYIKNSIFSNNTVTNSSEIGIDIMDSGSIDSNNIISYNNVNNCYCGIMLEHSWGNTYKNNTVNSNEFGIMVYGEANFNVITKNEVGKNGLGIVLYGFIQGKTYAPVGNLVVGNNIFENLYCGVYATVLTRLNHIYYNNFVGNYLNAFDNGTNIWYKSKIIGGMGNYWDDYTGSDNNDDGIGDSPYDVPPLPFRNKDRYPCMKPIDTGNIPSSYTELIQSSPQVQPQVNPQSNPQINLNIKQIDQTLKMTQQSSPIKN